MGVALHDTPVHEGARIALVAVADHIAGAWGLERHRVPLEAGGVTAAAAAPQAAALHLVPHLLGGEFTQAAAQLAVGAEGESVVDRFRVHPPAALQHHRTLQDEEGMLQIDTVGGQARLQ